MEKLDMTSKFENTSNQVTGNFVQGDVSGDLVANKLLRI
jgi:hypothetical protein